MNIDQYLIQKISQEQLLIVNELREICRQFLPFATEKLSYGVPHFYINKRVAFIWPTDIPKSGVSESGVLLGFWKGHLIQHRNHLFRGQSNRVVRFRVYQNLASLHKDIKNIRYWCEEAKQIDLSVFD